MTGQAGPGQVVAVVSGGNIDLPRFASLVGACGPSNRSVTPCAQSRPARPVAHHPWTDTPARFLIRIARLDRAGRRSLVELAPRGAPASSGSSTTTLWRATAHNPVRMLALVPTATLEAAAADPAFLRALSTRPIDGARRRAGGAQHLVDDAVSRNRPASRSPTSPPSSRCISRCRSTPAAWACWPAITARKPATSACRSSASASCTRRATSTSTSRPTAGRKRATSG